MGQGRLIIQYPKDRGPNKGEKPCFVCGRPTRGGLYCLVVDGGAQVAPPEHELAEQAEDPAGFMGFLEIGPCCAKQFPRSYLFRD